MSSEPFVEILGIAQDGGIPQAGCGCGRCEAAWSDPTAVERVACLGIVDPAAGAAYLVDATPDFRSQHRDLVRHAPLAGLLLTHAHIGHYTGLIHVGKEAMDLAGLSVLATASMQAFLAANAPWKQLLAEANIAPVVLEPGMRRALTGRVAVTPLAVPHRAEWSDTVAFRIDGPSRSVLYVPDIDRWEDWSVGAGGGSSGVRRTGGVRGVREIVGGVDVALIDGTFYSAGEAAGRDPARIPHPPVEHSLRLLAGIDTDIRFIHVNHSSPVLRDTEARAAVRRAGFGIARDGDRIGV